MMKLREQLEQLEIVVGLWDVERITQSHYDLFRRFDANKKSYPMLYLQSAILMKSNFIDFAGSGSQMEHDLSYILLVMFEKVSEFDPDYSPKPKGSFNISLEEISQGKVKTPDKTESGIERVNAVASSIRKHAPYIAVARTIDKIRDNVIERLRNSAELERGGYR